MQFAISFRNMFYIVLYLLFPNPNISSPTIVLYIMNHMIVLPAFRFFNHLKHFTNGSRETFRTSGDCRTSTKALVVPCFFIGDRMGKYWEDMDNYMIIYNGIHRSTYIYIHTLRNIFNPKRSQG